MNRYSFFSSTHLHVVSSIAKCSVFKLCDYFSDEFAQQLFCLLLVLSDSAF